MSALKTQPTDADVEAFLNRIDDDQKRKDAFAILEIMREITACEPVMWGESIVGLGTYRYKYASGRQGEWFLTGFSPRKRSLTLYVMSGFDRFEDLLSRLGKFTTGKGCLYINKLDDVHLPTLRELLERSVAHLSAEEK
jgi:hypothetical protein